MSLLCLFIKGLVGPGPNDESKDTDTRRWKNGFVVTSRGDTLQGKIKVIDFLDINYDYQRTVSFRNTKEKIISYLPADLFSFSYTDNDNHEHVTLQSVSSPEGDGRVFLRLYCSGSCKVYGLTITDVRGNTTGLEEGTTEMHPSLIPNEKKYIQIGGSQFYLLKRFNFKKNMKEIFASCPHIISGLDSKEYTYDNWEAMVRDYNNGCK